MDKEKIKALNKIQEMRDTRVSPDFESLARAGFHKSLLRSLIDQDLIRWNGIFSFTDKGENALRDYLLVDAQRLKPIEKIIFDTNIFDEIIDDKLNINQLIRYNEKSGTEFYITYVQLDEINKCSDEEKRANLFLLNSRIRPVVIPTESFIRGTSRLGEARLGDGKIFNGIRGGSPKNTNDALIGETAIKNGLTLVTSDKRLRKRVNSDNGKAISLEEFKKLIDLCP